MPRKPLSSDETIAVLRVFMDDTEKAFHGYEVAKTVGRSGGPVYRTLNRLEAKGLLSGEWDKAWTQGARRKLYTATMSGILFYQKHMASVDFNVLNPKTR
jgi:DNA-binding PadR family transcriptional regulator